MTASLRPIDPSGYSDALTKSIIGGAIEVQRYLGPGLLESTYEACFDVPVLCNGGWKRIVRHQ